VPFWPKLVVLELDTNSSRFYISIGGNYTLVQSDEQVCNASSDKDALNTGNQGAGSEYRYKVPFDSLRTYFSSTDGSCEKGMFGLINVSLLLLSRRKQWNLTSHIRVLEKAGISDKDNFGQAMSQMAAKYVPFLRVRVRVGGA
jgi:hypothetical protein